MEFKPDLEMVKDCVTDTLHDASSGVVGLVHPVPKTLKETANVEQSAAHMSNCNMISPTAIRESRIAHQGYSILTMSLKASPA